MLDRNSFRLSLSWIAAPVLLLAQAPAPTTARRPVTDEYHGVRVTDDYRWLEDSSNPAVQPWVASQNAYSRAYLDRLKSRDAIKRDLLAEGKMKSIRYRDLQVRARLYFLLKVDPARQQPFLVTTPSVDDLTGEKVVVDPNQGNAKGSLSIDWYVPSLDGKLVAVAMSEGGSEDASLYFYEAATGKQVGEVVPRVNYPTGGGSVAWLPDGKSVLYTRYPQGQERPQSDANFYQQIYLHRIGTPSSTDVYSLGKEFPRIAETTLKSDPAAKYVLASVANGDGGEFEHFLRQPDGSWRQITRFEDGIVSVSIGADEALYLLSRKNAPRGKVLRMPLTGRSLADAKLIVAEGRASIETPAQDSSDETLLATATKLYIQTIGGGPNQVDIYDHSGKPLGKLPLPASSSSGMLGASGDTVLLGVMGYLNPYAVFRYEGGKDLRATAVRAKPSADLSGFNVERAMAKSKDGTLIPMTIVHQKGLKRDGSTPALIYGYGGYGVSQSPAYLGNSNFRLWLEQGGTLVLTNLRGGAEFGEAWHLGGNLTHKQNVFDDFAACARYVIEEKYSSPEHIAALGASNGGLLMGAELTQHPELFRAVVSLVGIYDSLRDELDPNGAFNVTEFGSVKDPAQFKALYGYSPYHRVVNGTQYPAVLLMTGDNDGRVNPAHSRKMTARLQAATASPRPIFLRTSAGAGHGIGSSLNEQIEQQADLYAFLFDQLGIEYRPATRP